MLSRSQAIEVARAFCDKRTIPAGRRVWTRQPTQEKWLILFEHCCPPPEAQVRNPPSDVVIVEVCTVDGATEQLDTATELEAQLELYSAGLRSALKRSNPVPPPDSAGLAPVRARPIEVFDTPSSSMGLVASANALGTTMLANDRYLVMINTERIDLNRKVQDLWGCLARRFVVLHEYGHIVRGDVAGDNPWSALRRKFDMAAHKFSEDRANGFAAEMLAREREAAGDGAAAARFRHQIALDGWIAP